MRFIPPWMTRGRPCGGWAIRAGIMSKVLIKGLKKIYDNKVTAVHDVNLEIEDKEFIVLVGPSGCGKSTTLRMVAGLEDISEGELYIDGKLVNDVEPKDRDIAMVFQSYALYPHMTVYDNLGFALKLKKTPKDEIDRKVREVAEILDITQYLERKPKALSGGQRQRVAIGRAMVRNAKVFLMDEPLSNLDAKLRESMRFEIKEIQRSLGITVVYVTHDQTEAMAMSDRIFLINRGVVQQCGTPTQIYNEPSNQFVADFLGKIDFFKGEVQNGRIILRDMGGQSIPYSGPRTGKVDVAIRPENILFSAEGPLKGKLESQYYLGDVNDCRVRIGNTLVRVIAPGYAYRTLKNGQDVTLDIRDEMVFDDDGTLEEMLTIQT